MNSDHFLIREPNYPTDTALVWNWRRRKWVHDPTGRYLASAGFVYRYPWTALCRLDELREVKSGWGYTTFPAWVNMRVCDRNELNNHLGNA